VAVNVAIVYDRVNKFGGAERILQALHALYPTAPLFTSVYNPKTASWAKDFTVKTTFLQHIPFAKTNHEYIAPLIPMAFEDIHFDEFDVVISVTSEYGKGIITKPHTLHICYCLTPTRYLWSGYDEYFKDSFFKSLAEPAVSYLRNWDSMAAQRPDKYIAISKTVQSRIKKYYSRESDVIYPPVNLAASNWLLATNKKNEARSQKPIQHAQGEPGASSYLLVSRLVPYKRIDIAIEACNMVGLPLTIVGTGREYARLKALAGPTITFVQNLTDEALSRYYQDCTALLYTAHEDFGIAVVEAQSFGKPVIAYGMGGATETVKKGVTGEFFYTQTKEALGDVLKEFKPEKYDPKDCRDQAEKFSQARFMKEFKMQIEQIYKEYNKNR
jgi:glycosyltransferase involved in cell wall biosynthesis